MSDGSRDTGGRLRGWLAGPSATAILSWLIATPVGFALPRIVPSNSHGGFRWLAVALAGGFLSAAVIWVISLRWRGGWVAGLTAGAMSGWITLALAAATRGTPFPFQGLLGDAGRVTAMATRYSVTPASSDMMIPGIPAEYPPLFPWVVGRTSALIDVPAWRLVGDFEIIFTAAAVLIGFLLWVRLLPPWLALLTTVTGFMSFAVPAKAYELLALTAFVPWVLLTFINPPRGRLHWLASGVVAGLIFLSYFGWMIFGSFAVLALAWRTWRGEENRKAFLLYLAKVAGVALVLASWFIIPLVHAKFTIGGTTVADLYGSSNMLDLIFPFLHVTYPGFAGLFAILQLIGLIGLIWLRGRVWWAAPLLTLVVGAYAYRLFGALVFVLTQHTLLSQYTPAIYGSAMAIAAPLTLAHAVPRLLRRLSLTAPRLGTATVIAISLVYTGYTFCIDWTPGTGGRYSDYTERAYREPYPDGTRIQGFSNPTPWFPVEPIRQAVEGTLGPDHDAVVLSADERIWSYLPWHGYIGNDLWSSVAHSLERVEDVRNLSTVTNPAEFTDRSANLRRGRIDIFILKKAPQGWLWSFHQGFGQPEVDIYFQREQFDPSRWATVDVPEDYVVVIRR